MRYLCGLFSLFLFSASHASFYAVTMTNSDRANNVCFGLFNQNDTAENGHIPILNKSASINTLGNVKLSADVGFDNDITVAIYNAKPKGQRVSCNPVTDKIASIKIGADRNDHAYKYSCIYNGTSRTITCNQTTDKQVCSLLNPGDTNCEWPAVFQQW
ncbi:MAG TPA: hypothetical protein VEL47_05955 [Myxococcota bacterium]|nr:hypothetical protein [Myxococcota bacterium]